MQLAVNIEKRAVTAETKLNEQLQLVAQLQAQISELQAAAQAQPAPVEPAPPHPAPTESAPAQPPPVETKVS